MASSDPKGAVSASTGNRPGAPAESPVAGRTVQKKTDASVTGSTHANAPQRTPPKTEAGGTGQGQPHCGAPNGYDAERA